MDCALRPVNRELKDRGRIITHRQDVIIPQRSHALTYLAA
jgi:hypothetical protein